MSFNEVSVFDLSAIPDYNRLPAVLAETAQEFASANQAYEELGRRGLGELFAQALNSGHDVITTIDRPVAILPMSYEARHVAIYKQIQGACTIIVS